MARPNEWDEQWRQMAALLRRYRRSGGLTLDEAQQLFDAAPDLPLSPVFVQSVLAHVRQHRTPEAAATACHWLGEGVLCTTGWVPWTAALVEPPSVIGIHGSPASAEGMTRIQSDVVDARRIVMPWPSPTWDLGAQPTDSMVFDVALGCPDWDRSLVCRIRQGTLRWDACIDGHGLDACQVASLFDSWCESADHESDWGGRFFSN